MNPIRLIMLIGLLFAGAVLGGIYYFRTQSKESSPRRGMAQPSHVIRVFAKVGSPAMPGC
jgi:hypothetical protein